LTVQTGSGILLGIGDWMTLNEQQQRIVNHITGPCLAAACPGSGKCLSGDTIVCSQGQLISEIQQNAISTTISVLDESLQKPGLTAGRIQEFYRDPENRRTIKIECESGFSLQGTICHPIAVVGENGRLEWRQLGNLVVGDICPIWVDKRQIGEHELDDDFYLMGLLLGDGCLCLKKGAVCFSSEENNVANRFVEICEKNKFKVSKYHDKRRKNLFSCVVNSKKFIEWLSSKFGDIRHSSSSKYLTDQMLSGSKTAISSLLRGLFDTDGYADTKGVGICLSSEKLIRQLHILLLHFGVVSNLSCKYISYSYRSKASVRKYFRIAIHGNDFRRFVQNIGFSHIGKKNQSELILSRQSNPNKRFELLHGLMREIRDEVRTKEFWNGKTGEVVGLKSSFRLSRYCARTGNASRNITEQSASKLLLALKDRGFDSDNVRYLNFLVSNFEFVKIKKVSTIESPEPVYDYVVEKSHNFISNGFVSHNTRTLTVRVGKMIQQGIDPLHILCLTFTNKAADEMRDRLAKMVGPESKKIWISTFHHLCVAILRKYGDKIGYPVDKNGRATFSIYDDKDQNALLMKVARMNGEENFTEYDAKRVARYANDSREDLCDLSKYGSELKTGEAEIIQEYFKLLDEFHAVDFSGILFKAYVLIKNHPDVAEALARKFQYVSVDEAQDTNHIQYELVKLLAPHRNLLMVGDYQQSIYRFRGAKPENLNHFLTDFPDAFVVNFETNYRSKQSILDAAQRLIHHNDNGKDVVLKAHRGPGGVVRTTEHNTPESEAESVVAAIRSLKQKSTLRWRDFAVLYRVNSLSNLPEVKLRQSAIPYKVVGGFSFFDRNEIKTCLAYLSFAANPNDTVAFARAISWPKRGIGDVLVGKLEAYCKDHHVDMLAACKAGIIKMTSKAEAKLHEFVQLVEKCRAMDVDPKVPLDQVASALFKQSGYYQSMQTASQGDPDFQKRVDNIDQFLVSVADYGLHRPSCTISDYLHTVQLLTDIDKEEEDDAVSLLTMHSAKGCEFEHVFLIGVEESLIPHYRCLSDIDEERRLMYVACTRPSLGLYVNYCATRDLYNTKSNKIYRIKCEPSRFISEMIL
jgi:DNA helicase-2/ATP-dependent DNA helicase PcrA